MARAVHFFVPAFGSPDGLPRKSPDPSPAGGLFFNFVRATLEVLGADLALPRIYKWQDRENPYAHS
jgi:hypothetical protein